MSRLTLFGMVLVVALLAVSALVIIWVWVLCTETVCNDGVGILGIPHRHVVSGFLAADLVAVAAMAYFVLSRRTENR